jgi:glycosidase
MRRTLLLVVAFYFLLFQQSLTQTAFNKPPAWAKDVIWYQIFVERFSNGDTANDPYPEVMNVPDMKIFTPENWKITPWTSDWFKKDSWMEGSKKIFSELLQYRRYGGDLQGVLNKLDYLQDLGITAIYFNPLNDAPSLHKYDARYYHHIDVNFGPDPEGDLRIIKSENPAEPKTWQWTSADKLFLKIVQECHERGIKVIMDYSWNHTGTLFWAWQDILKNQSKSVFKDWYNINTFDNPETPENEFSYSGWYGNAYMPEFKKLDIKGERINGIPYEGNMPEGVKNHVFEVSRRWLAPSGDTSKGIDGFRLDVAEQIGLQFWRDYRKFVRSVKHDAYLLGEIWWEKWPDKLMNPAPYLQGDVFDAVMFYQVYKPARYFFADTGIPFDAKMLKDSLQKEWGRVSEDNLYAMMNVSSSHDTPRLLSDFFNSGKYKYLVSPNDNPDYKTGKPDLETYKRLRLYLIHLFTNIGAPQIWNGEEMGMWGADDPFPRKPLWWSKLKFEKENRNNVKDIKPVYDKVGFDKNQFSFYKKLIQIRKSNKALIDGKFEFITTENKLLIYKRYNHSDELIVVLNAGTETETAILPAYNYFDLLSGKILKVNKIRLKPLSGMILKPL